MTKNTGYVTFEIRRRIETRRQPTITPIPLHQTTHHVLRKLVGVWFKLIYLVRCYNGTTSNSVHVNHARTRSWSCPVLSNEGKLLSSMKHRAPLVVFEQTYYLYA